MTVFKRGSVYKYHFVVNGEHVQKSTRQGNLRVAREMEAAHRTRLAKGEAGIRDRKPIPTLKEFAPRFKDFLETNNGNKPETVTWTDIQLEPVGSAAFGYVRVGEGKSKQAKRTAPITARARLMLEERLQRVAVSQGQRSSEFSVEASLDHLHAEVRPLMKTPSEDFVLHSLRHTMLTRFGETGADSFTIKKTAGHSSVTTSEKYIHPSGETIE
jgi:hypothetical protein